MSSHRIMRIKMFKLLTILIGSFVINSADASEGFNIEFGLGATYRNAYTDGAVEYKNTYGFPSFGMTAISGNRKFKLRSSLEYSTFKLERTIGSTTVTNSILSWTTYGTFMMGNFYFGPGGGGGYEKNSEGYDVGHSFFGINLGAQFSKNLSLDLRVFTPIGNTYDFKNLWAICSLKFLIATGG